MQTIIVTGEKAEGKTSFLLKLADEAKTRNISVSGILSLRIMRKTETIGYDLFDIENRDRIPLLTDHPMENAPKIGRFYFHQNALDIGKEKVEKSMQSSQWIILDEVGKSELENSGWNDLIIKVKKEFSGIFILAVRRSFVAEVIGKYKFQDCKVIDISELTIQDFWNSFM